MEIEFLVQSDVLSVNLNVAVTFMTCIVILSAMTNSSLASVCNFMDPLRVIATYSGMQDPANPTMDLWIRLGD